MIATLIVFFLSLLMSLITIDAFIVDALNKSNNLTVRFICMALTTIGWTLFYYLKTNP